MLATLSWTVQQLLYLGTWLRPKGGGVPRFLIWLFSNRVCLDDTRAKLYRYVIKGGSMAWREYLIKQAHIYNGKPNLICVEQQIRLFSSHALKRGKSPQKR